MNEKIKPIEETARNKKEFEKLASKLKNRIKDDDLGGLLNNNEKKKKKSFRKSSRCT